MGKLIAERSFAQAAARSGRWEAIAGLPSDNVGPIQSAHQKAMGPWQSQVAMMLQGKYPQNRSYRPWMPVDVRDNAGAERVVPLCGRCQPPWSRARRSTAVKSASSAQPSAAASSAASDAAANASVSVENLADTSMPRDRRI